MTTDKKKDIIFKAEDYQYPNKEERRFASKKIPNFSDFGFEFKSEIILAFSGVPILDAMAQQNLYWWDNVLTNRFGSLRSSYTEVLTHFNRGFKDEFIKCTDEEMLNRIQFDNHAEIFYYYYFSALDVIAHIINQFYPSLRINIDNDNKDKGLSFNESFIKKIPVEQIKIILKEFNNSIEFSREIRNSFVHRFPKNYPDYRASIERKKGKTIMHGGSGRYIKPSQILKDIEHCLNALAELMKKLKENMMQ